MIYLVAKYQVNDIPNATINDCEQYIKTKDVLGLDIETSANSKFGHLSNKVYSAGLDPHLSRVIMLQIGDLERQYIIDVRDYSFEELKPILDILHWNKDTTFVGHNLKFEGVHLRHNYGVRLNRVYDTMMAEISLNNGITEGLSLEVLAKKYLNVKSNYTFDLFSQEEIVDLDPTEEWHKTAFEIEDAIQLDKSTRLQFITMTSEAFSEEQIQYGGLDIELPLKIRDFQLAGHRKLGFHFLNMSNILFESNYTQVAADMEYNGMPFDVVHWKQLAKTNEEVYSSRLTQLNDYIANTFPKYNQLTLFGGSTCVIDWSSPKQVISFFRELDICPKEKSKQTKRLEWSVSAKALLPTLDLDRAGVYYKDKTLDSIEDYEDLKLAYLLLRKAQMNITTYGLDFLKYVHPVTGRLHPKYRMHLASSRTATTSPNLLAIPSTHRDAFNVNNKPDRKLIINDYSSQESRIIASLSDDPLLIKFFNEGSEEFGSDFHSYTTQLIEDARGSGFKMFHNKHEKFTKEMAIKRQNTKAVNFGLA